MVLAALAALSIATEARASTTGDSIQAEFNYASLYLGLNYAGDVDSLVLKPPATPIGINGEYTDTDGDFTVPKDTGLTFPPVALDLDLLQISGEIGLTGDGTGHYDEATGAMTVDLNLSLTLGVDDLDALSKEVGTPLGTGELACRLSPLEVEFSTAGGWPHPGKAFTDKNALTDGALAGAWGTKPGIVAVEGDQSVCNIIGGLLRPVGGIWLANSSTEISDLPVSPIILPCPLENTLQRVCSPPEVENPGWQHPCVGCPLGEGDGVAAVTGLKLTPSRTRLRAGGSRILLLRVRNTGKKQAVQEIRFSSDNSRVRVRLSLRVTVPAGSTVTRKVKVKTGARAVGRSVITASTAGLTAKSTLILKRPAKRR